MEKIPEKKEICKDFWIRVILKYYHFMAIRAVFPAMLA